MKDWPIHAKEILWLDDTRIVFRSTSGSLYIGIGTTDKSSDPYSSTKVSYKCNELEFKGRTD